MGEVAEQMGKEPVEALCDLVIAIQGEASIVVYQQSEENVIKAMKQEYVAIGSDGLHSGAPSSIIWNLPAGFAEICQRAEAILAEVIRR